MPSPVVNLIEYAYHAYHLTQERSRLLSSMNGQYRKSVSAGIEVDVILKKDQDSGKLTRGVVKEILTNSSFHPHGIKVRLVSGEVGRVQEVFHTNQMKVITTPQE